MISVLGTHHVSLRSDLEVCTTSVTHTWKHRAHRVMFQPLFCCLWAIEVEYGMAAHYSICLQNNHIFSLNSAWTTRGNLLQIPKLLRNVTNGLTHCVGLIRLSKDKIMATRNGKACCDDRFNV